MTASVRFQPSETKCVPEISLETMLNNALKLDLCTQEKDAVLRRVKELSGRNEQDASKLTELAITLLTVGVPGVIQKYKDAEFSRVLLKEARDILGKALALNPDNADALAYLALVIKESWLVFDLQEALSHVKFRIPGYVYLPKIMTIFVQQVLQLDANHPIGSIMKAELELERSKHTTTLRPLAEDALRGILAKNPQNVYALRVLGDFLSVQNNPFCEAASRIEKGIPTEAWPSGPIPVNLVHIQYAGSLSHKERSFRILLAEEGDEMQKRAERLLQVYRDS